jgi:hypothetical protein
MDGQHRHKMAGPVLGATSYDEWSAALLDVLLPQLPDERKGQVVLLACDDGAVRAAATALGVGAEDPTTEFGGVVEARFNIGRDGSPESLRRPATQFRRRDRDPDAVAPFFGACCAFVLAASRMTTDGGTHAVNYYDRLWEVLGRRPSRTGQYDFRYLPQLFRYLADWLRDDLHGTRGHLHIAEGGPHHVGYAINQCLFRERDKEHLGEFFASRVGRLRGEFDLVRLLQVSSDRHRLTHRARKALAAPELQDLVRPALTHAFETWDGSRPDPRGGRSWLATLHLSVNRRFRLTISAPEAPPGLALGDGRLLEKPDRDRVPLHATQLVELAARGLRWGKPNANGIYLPATGDTLVFEVREDTGLAWVPSPTADHVFVLTSDHALQHKLAVYTARVPGTEALPPRWGLYERVPAGQLPADVGSPVVTRTSVALTGGLRLGPSQYLTGHGPRVEVGIVDEPLMVRVDDADTAIVRAGEGLSLDLLAGEHRVDVGGGLVRWTIHMLDRNPARPAYGQLAYPLTDRAVRAGASTQTRADGATVCGALLSDADKGDIPLMLRARRVVLIAADGRSETRHAPDPPRWLEHIGLPVAGVRWEVELAPNVIWALTSQQAVAVRPEVPAQLDAEARAAVDALCRGSEPRVRSLHRVDRDAAVEAFLEMATLPEATTS